MRHNYARAFTALAFACFAAIASAQMQTDEPAANVISRSIVSVGYPVNNSTKISFTGTKAAPQASGEAMVEAHTGPTHVEMKVKGLPQPISLGPEFLTYVIWSVTPDGNVANIGEIGIDKNGDGFLDTHTLPQTFALAVTAEPYSVVRLPSEEVVLVNEPTKNTKGKIFPENSYKLMARSQYAKEGNPLGLNPDLKSAPLEVYQARNAVEIARARGAEKYAPDIYKKAVASLQIMENSLTGGADKKQVITNARQTMQFAEDSRSLSARNQEAERIQAKQDAAAAQAKATADAQAAAAAKQQAELTAAKEAQMKAESDAATAEARAKADAAKAETERVKSTAIAARAELLAQLNAVLETKDTPRGLIVNMADVLFETGKYNLSTDAQLKLAKLAGIIQAHPGLKLAIEGYTDSTGGDELNMKLSQQRSDAVREFLISQGLSGNTITASGLGEANPIADNNTAAGRKANRRVEIILSGEVIGAKIG